MKILRKRNTGPESLRTEKTMENTRDKMEEEMAGSTGSVSNGETPRGESSDNRQLE